MDMAYFWHFFLFRRWITVVWTGDFVDTSIRCRERQNREIGCLSFFVARNT